MTELEKHLEKQKTINLLYCPFCGREMNADLHFPMDCWYVADNWICMDCPKAKTTIAFDRKDIEEMLG